MSFTTTNKFIKNTKNINKKRYSHCLSNQYKLSKSHNFHNLNNSHNFSPSLKKNNE